MFEKLSQSVFFLSRDWLRFHTSDIMIKSTLYEKLLHHHKSTLFLPLNARVCNSFAPLMSLIGSFNFCFPSLILHLFVDGKYFLFSCFDFHLHFSCSALTILQWHCTNNHSNYISCIVVFFSLARQVCYSLPSLSRCCFSHHK